MSATLKTIAATDVDVSTQEKLLEDLGEFRTAAEDFVEIQCHDVEDKMAALTILLCAAAISVMQGNGLNPEESKAFFCAMVRDGSVFVPDYRSENKPSGDQKAN